MRSIGNRNGAEILKNVVDDPPMALEYERAYVQAEISRISPEEALGMVVDGQFSRYKYNIIRSKAPQVFPSYKVIQQTKKTCYPSNIITSQTSVSVGLQDLLDHTILRLLHSIDEDLITNLEDQELSLITKWGFDGTTGHTQYKQAFLDYSVSDSHALITALVPLLLCFKDKIIWQNPKPSSTRYCRPLKIKYIKEYNDVVIRQKKRY